MSNKVNAKNPINTDLKAVKCNSLISAESTIKSALLREESRGSHYRNDFPILSKEGKYNLNTSYENNSVIVKKVACKNLDPELNKYVKKHKQIDDLTGKLIE